MTKNQQAMKNIGRGSATGHRDLKPDNRRRYEADRAGTTAKWAALDAARTSRYRVRRAERERKEAEAARQRARGSEVCA